MGHSRWSTVLTLRRPSTSPHIAQTRPAPIRAFTAHPRETPSRATRARNTFRRPTARRSRVPLHVTVRRACRLSEQEFQTQRRFAIAPREHSAKRTRRFLPHVQAEHSARLAPAHPLRVSLARSVPLRAPRRLRALPVISARRVGWLRRCPARPGPSPVMLAPPLASARVAVRGGQTAPAALTATASARCPSRSYACSVCCCCWPP